MNIPFSQMQTLIPQGTIILSFQIVSPKIETYETQFRDCVFENTTKPTELLSTFCFALLGDIIVDTKFPLLIVHHLQVMNNKEVRKYISVLLR